MSNKRRPGFEIVTQLHGGRTCTQLAASAQRAPLPARPPIPPTPNLLSGNTYTFVPGRSAPIVRGGGDPVGNEEERVDTLTNSILVSRANEEEQRLRCLIQGRKGRNPPARPPPSHPHHNRGEREDDTSEALVNPEAIMQQLAHERRQTHIRRTKQGWVGEPADFSGQERRRPRYPSADAAGAGATGRGQGERGREQLAAGKAKGLVLAASRRQAVAPK
ncbi:hypothetical protein B0H14DRAFT_3539117 [Mycena olivaceomarginata]|nr:hypothetical protein B0H14DRAFT_3539117 [Mycena olivaceomarginata]